MLLTLICIFADFLLLPPTLLLVEGLGGWPASPPQFPLQRVREAPWGSSRCGLPCEGSPEVGLPGAGLPVRAFPLRGCPCRTLPGAASSERDGLLSEPP